ncbi:MAG: hypothetical protein AAGD96_13035 [Chloroflexota bacterium]
MSYRTQPPTNKPSFQIVKGRRPILLSAPHATKHTRNGHSKMEEEFTGGLALLLAEQTGCHVIYNRWESPDDPNWDQESEYKKQLAQIVQDEDIKLVVDLHGMTNRHKIGVALGTINGRACPDYERPLQDAFVRAGFRKIAINSLSDLKLQEWDRLVVNHPRFTGGIKSHTITRFASQTLGVQAAQVEVTSTARIVYREPHDGWPFHYFGEREAIRTMIRALVGFLKEA